MARMRVVKPEFWTDSTIVQLSSWARLFYIGSWNFALCDKGHLPDDAISLKLQILPADPVNAEDLVEELIKFGRFRRITMADGRTYLHAHKLPNHQKVDARWQTRCPYCTLETSPDAPQPHVTSPWHDEPHQNSREARRDSAELSEPPSSKGWDGIGGEGNQNPCAASAARTIITEPMPGLDVPPPPPKPARSSPRKPRFTKAEFDDLWKRFYAVYPRKKNPAEGRRAFEKLLLADADLDPEMLIAAAERFADERRGKDVTRTPYPASWLNAGGYLSEPDPPSDEELAAAAEARRAEYDAKVAELRRTEPSCEHEQPAGRSPHPATGLMLCPHCRLGLPARPEDPQPETDPNVLAVVNEYRVGMKAAGRLFDTAHLLEVTGEATRLLRTGGIHLSSVLDVAEPAGRAGRSLTEQQTIHNAELRMGAPA